MPMYFPPLLLTGLCIVVALRLRRERLVTGWLLWSGMIHVFMELSYGFFSDVVTQRSDITFAEFMAQPTSAFGFLDPRWWAHIYEQYARYDGRYLDHDPMILLITHAELLMGPPCWASEVSPPASPVWRRSPSSSLSSSQSSRLCSGWFAAAGESRRSAKPSAATRRSECRRTRVEVRLSMRTTTGTICTKS